MPPKLLQDHPWRKLGLFESIVVSDQFDFAYVSVAKASNTSVKQALLPTVGLTPDDELNGVKVARILHDKISGPYHYESLAKVASKRPALVFSVVRNTWSRVLSCYKDKILHRFHQPFASYGFDPSLSFSQFVKEIAAIPDELAEVHFRSQLSSLMHQGEFVPNLILRTESLPAQWAILQAHFRVNFDLKLDDLGHLNRREVQFDTDELNLEVVKTIYERYRSEIDFFGFKPPAEFFGRERAVVRNAEVASR